MTRQKRQQTEGVSSKVLLDNMASIADESAAKRSIVSVREYLEPVLTAARSQQENLTACSQRLAKSYSSFVVHLLRASMVEVNSDQTPALRAAYVELASLGLEGLSVLRGSLKGRPYEVEVQRYMLLRKLVSLACYPQAVQQAWLLYTALCCHSWQPDSQAFTTHCMNSAAQPLPKPDTNNIEIGSLVAGAVLNMLLSIVEQSSIQSDLYKVMSIVCDYDSIMNWLR